MNKLLSVFAIISVFTAFTTIDSGIDGTWTATVQGPQGEVEITYNFDVEGDTLTGTVVGGMGEVEILNGVVDGDEFSFDTKFNGATISHDCVLESENKIMMEFRFEGPGGQGPQGPQELVLTREKESENTAQ